MTAQLRQAKRPRHHTPPLPRLARPIAPIRLEPEPFSFGPTDRLSEWGAALLALALCLGVLAALWLGGYV